MADSYTRPPGLTAINWRAVCTGLNATPGGSVSASVSLYPSRKCSAHRLTARGLPCIGLATVPSMDKSRRGTMLVVWSSVPVLSSGDAVLWVYRANRIEVGASASSGTHTSLNPASPTEDRRWPGRGAYGIGSTSSLMAAVMLATGVTVRSENWPRVHDCSAPVWYRPSPLFGALDVASQDAAKKMSRRTYHRHSPPSIEALTQQSIRKVSSSGVTQSASVAFRMAWLTGISISSYSVE